MPSINSPTPDATTGSKGKVQLAGDLSGTAAAPTVGNAKITPDKLATGAAGASVNTNETTSSTTYTDLATTTDTVTVTIGANGLALVFLNCWAGSNTGNAQAWMGFAISGASTVAAADTSATFNQAYTAGGVNGQAAPILVTGLTPGSTTFKAKYRTTSGIANFQNRRIAVLPL